MSLIHLSCVSISPGLHCDKDVIRRGCVEQPRVDQLVRRLDDEELDRASLATTLIYVRFKDHVIVIVAGDTRMMSHILF